MKLLKECVLGQGDVWHLIMVTFCFSVSKLCPLKSFMLIFMFFHSCIPHNRIFNAVTKQSLIYSLTQSWFRTGFIEFIK